MIRIHLLSKTTLIASGIASLVAVTANFSSIVPPADANVACPVTDAEIKTWFDSGKVTLNGVAKPANSLAFPDKPNCSFYKWTEQMFLWLTSPAPPKYGGGDRIFNSEKFYDVSPPGADGRRSFLPHKAGNFRTFNLRVSKLGAHRLPVVIERHTGRILEVETAPRSAGGRPLVLDAENKSVEIASFWLDQNRRPVFINKEGLVIAKPRPVIMHKELPLTSTIHKITLNNQVFFLDHAGNVVELEQGQAEGDEVLMAQNGSLVYYATTVNEVYAYYRTSFGNNDVPDNAQFPTTGASIEAIKSFASSHGKTIIDPEAMAIEVKTSWIEAAGLSEPEKFIRMKGTIPTYDRSNPKKWILNGQKTVELAMVGMHIVGSTKGHPELLWGTFEHVSNAPDAAYNYLNTQGVTTPKPQSTAGNWLFCAGGASTGFNEPHMIVSKDTIVATDGFTISPSNIIRWKAWGAAGIAAKSNAEVISINNIVRGQLLDGDVRKNYIHTGTTWTPNGAPATGSNSVGTGLLCNTTMETFRQGVDNTSQAGFNCFSCHNVNSQKPELKNINTVELSHIFKPLKPLF